MTSVKFIKKCINEGRSKYGDRNWDKAEEYNPIEYFKYYPGANVVYDPDADFEYFTSESSVHDGTLLFEVELIREVVARVAMGYTYYIPKGIPKNKLKYTIGNIIVLNEYEESADWIPQNKPWMHQRTTVCLPLKTEEVIE